MISLANNTRQTSIVAGLAALAVVAAATVGMTTAAAKTKKPNSSEQGDSDAHAPVPSEEEYESAPRVRYQPRNPSDAETYEYASNPTVYGKILRGELKTRLLLETDHLVAFEDIWPRAPLHGLIIPKERIASVLDLDWNNKKHRLLLTELQLEATKLVRDKLPDAYDTEDYLLCFHIPPFNSVDHLHLHVLAPASKMGRLSRYGEFPTTAQGDAQIRWNISLDKVLARLKEGSAPTPYPKDQGYLKNTLDVFKSIGTVLFAK